MTPAASAARPDVLGVVVHPSRDIGGPLEELGDWAGRHRAEIVQVPVPGQTRQVAPRGQAQDCSLLVSIGGDGTMLAAIRATLSGGCPVLGVACGSLGVLARTAPGELSVALDRFRAGDWTARDLPALHVDRGAEPALLAINDLAVLRAGIGQIRVVARVDGELYGRLAGDGVIVATALGSSAYTLAAGGPLLALDAGAFVITALATHGGVFPPLVLGSRSRVALEISAGYGGARLEVDGQAVPEAPERLLITLRPTVARLVAFADQEPLLTVLRRRGILLDSPRILAEESRA